MKLKELHVRNIASIEQADIDFEKDLNDAVTGSPASIFLISGDTGAGKSVILDSISMALYKKTPRIADVANVTKNDYTDAEGEQIRVASIEQYTRLGISPKDESYSEVVFEGNDGKTYRARLTLGLKHGAKDKETGIRPIKHNKPVWEVRTGNADWTKDSVEQTILDAVGLDFQQFGRMAMLAQGQFANFLTGDKKEREAILEQLTNTQHFTAYGEAIYSLWKKAKDNQAQIQTQYDTEKPHTLTEEQVEQFVKEQADAQTQMDQCDRDINATEGMLKQVETILQNEKAQTEAKKVREELEAKMAGEEYCRCKALFKDWDSTTEQRKWLSDLLKARQDEVMAKTRLALEKEKFRALTADLADRQAKADRQEETIRRMQEWIDKEARYETLFTTAGETDLKIGQYLDKAKKAGLKSATLKQERGRTGELKKAEAEAKAQLSEVEKAVEELQRRIDELNKKRSALNPQSVVEELKRQNTRKQNLTGLQTAMDNLIPIREENQALKKKLQDDEEELKRLSKDWEQADAEWKAKKQDAEKASQRLTTMKMSLDDKIKELRHRLYCEHTENCPLCGQHIEHIHIDDDFKGMLTPLEKEVREADTARKLAEGRRDKAKSNHDQRQGEYKNDMKRFGDNDKKISLGQKAIEGKAVELGLDLQKDLSLQIAETNEMLTSSIAKLESAQREAEQLQEDINRLIEEKKPFDNKRTECNKAKVVAETAVKTNAEDINRLEEERAELIRECETLKTDISTMVADYCNDWLADIEALRIKLKDDAKTYIDRRKRLSDSREELEKVRSLISTLEQYAQEICRSCPDWACNTIPQPYPCSNINTEWTNLLRTVASLVSKSDESKEVVQNTEKALAAYYQETGKTEQSLYELATQGTKVAEARTLVNETDTELKSRSDAIDAAQKQIDDALKKLGITDRDELPDKQELEEHKKEVVGKRDEAVAKKTQAESRLEIHRKNIERLKEIEAELEEAKKHFARWDKLNSIFGGTRFRTLVQTYILRPLLNNANIYLEQITDRYRLTCSEDNEQLSILVLDRYNKNQVRSVTVLSGGERFMISLALSLALSSLNRPDMNVNILFIDEGFGTLDEKSLDSVMSTLEKLQEIAGQSNRRVGIISHREELDERIPVQIRVTKRGEGRSMVSTKNE